MSSDNYYLIREVDGRFVVDVGFAPRDTHPPPDRYSRWFDTFEQAAQYATRDGSEYGIVLGAGLSDYGGDLPDGGTL